MPEVRYTGDGRYRVAGTTFEHGDTAEVSGGLAERLVDDVGKFEEIVDVGSDAAGEDSDDGEAEADAEADPETDAVEGESGTLPFNPDAKTVSEIKDAIADVDDPAAVRAVRNLEQDQQDRTTAVDAINDRLDELEG